MATPPLENTDIVRRYWKEVFNEGSLDTVNKALGDLVAADHVFNTPDPSEKKVGSDMLESIVVLFRTVLPDLHVDFDEEMIAEGDKVVSRWTARGSLSTKLKAVGITGDEETFSGISVFRISDGKIAETWQWLEPLRDQSEPPPMPRQEAIDELGKDRRIAVLFGADKQKRFDWICKVCPRCC